MTRQAKLVQLRRKTDRDLLILVRRELDRGLALADVATNRESPLYGQAQKAYRTVKALLPGMGGPTQSERRDLELALRELRAALEHLPDRQVQRQMVGTCKAE